MPASLLDPLMIVLQTGGVSSVAEFVVHLLAIPFIAAGWFIRFGVLLFWLGGLWKLFEKAGQAGLLCVIPIFNVITLARIAGWEGLKIVTLFIPGINVFFLVLLHFDLARVFGRESGFMLGVIALPWLFLPIMGWDDCRYRGVGALV